MTSAQKKTNIVDAFFDAIVSNNFDEIVSMLDAGQVSPDWRLSSLSALCCAAIYGNVRIVELLLDCGASIDRVSVHDGFSGIACLFAAQNGHIDVVNLLVARGDQTALPVAVERRDASAALALIDAGSPFDNETAFAAAALGANVARRLLECGVDIGALRDETDCSVLHVVAECPPDDAAELIDLLISNACIDINAIDCIECTCAHVAADFWHISVLRQLIRLGANVNLADRDGMSPLHVACMHENDYEDETRPCVALLLAACADVDARTKKSRETACHFAAKTSDCSLLSYLLVEGADFDALDASGVTPRQHWGLLTPMPTADELATARCRIARDRLELVRDRALQVCVALQSLRLSALQTCEILLHSCGPAAARVPFHHWWKIATLVKHFRSRQGQPVFSVK